MHESRPGSTARIRAARRRARSTVLAVLIAVTVGLATTGMTPMRQATDEKPQQAAGVATPARPDARTPATETSSFPLGAAEHCESTQAGSKERRAGAVEACVSVGPAPTARTAAQVRGLAAGSCDNGGPGVYSYGRFEYCVTGMDVLYVLRNDKGTEIGRGTLEIATRASLPAKGTTWNEQITVKMIGASGDVTTLNAKFRASCGTGCTATKTAPWYGGDLVLGQSLSGTVAYSSAPAAGAVAEFTTSYKMYVTSPGATAVDPNASWDNPRRIRCDDALGGTSRAGCAVPSVMPVVPMKTTNADPGGAVSAYDWAQKNLDGAWGKKGSPLTRSTNGVAARTAGTCGGFKAQPELVTADTCGDFPFGEAKEGGAPGAQCAEVIPNLGDGEWDTYVLNDGHVLNPAAPCVQAHVTPAEKQFADTQLADGFVDQRVIDADRFELAVSAPDTGPQIHCLNKPKPDDSFDNEGGWFRTTTEPVPLVNRINEASGPGQRPTRATACLGLDTPEGKGTSDPITGWEDAQDFRTKHGQSAGLSRCHLIASILGGRGNDARTRSNLVPCWQTGLNTGTPSMRTYEAITQKLIKGKPPGIGADEAVFYQVTPVYKNVESTVPVGVTMSAHVERANGATEKAFTNVYVTNTLGNTGMFNLGN
ncbi:hypothetical protein B4N89_36255 [Embleya scabrispora]|uniref:Type VII secretion system protein EssD-like domain-containing protein n=1 Tax=Embleya scabrispora TaxID=159449 RepID=A0A1T3NM36_9ACTN|nr:hypothetical protein B4N89_36255 [Embleya scabrispora]